MFNPCVVANAQCSNRKNTKKIFDIKSEIQEIFSGLPAKWGSHVVTETTIALDRPRPIATQLPSSDFEFLDARCFWHTWHAVLFEQNRLKAANSPVKTSFLHISTHFYTSTVLLRHFFASFSITSKSPNPNGQRQNELDSRRYTLRTKTARKLRLTKTICTSKELIYCSEIIQFCFPSTAICEALLTSGAYMYIYVYIISLRRQCLSVYQLFVGLLACSFVYPLLSRTAPNS